MVIFLFSYYIMCPYPTCNKVFLNQCSVFLIRNPQLPSHFPTGPVLTHVQKSFCRAFLTQRKRFGRLNYSLLFHHHLPSSVECESGPWGCSCIATMRIRASTLGMVGMKARETWVPSIIFKPLNQPLVGNSSTCSVLNSKLLFPKKLLVGFSAYLQPNTF